MIKASNFPSLIQGDNCTISSFQLTDSIEHLGQRVKVQQDF